MDELVYKDHGRRGKWIVIFGVVLALVAGSGAFYLLNQAQQQAVSTGVPTVQVVVAAREIPSRKPIEAGDVVIRRVLEDVTNASAYTAVADVVGRISAVTISTGQLVTRNLLHYRAQRNGGWVEPDLFPLEGFHAGPVAGFSSPAFGKSR